MILNKFSYILKSFGLKSECSEIKTITSGHINSTYKIIYSDGSAYILQQINKAIFKSPEKIMSNIDNLCKYFKDFSCFPRFILINGKNYLTVDNEIWRIYRYIGNSVSYISLDDSFKLYEFGRTLGNFHNTLKNADISKFYVTIENFHNTAMRVEKVIYLTDKKFSDYTGFFNNILRYVKKLDMKKLPLSVAHNDVKCSNVLFDSKTGKGLTLIDFDTVMPGLHVHDFGDGTRSACVSNNKIDIDKLRAYSKGYFSVIRASQEEEYFLGMLCICAELSARYLYDYLSEENYFKDKTPEEKLKRADELIKISESIIEKENEILSVIRSAFQVQ